MKDSPVLLKPVLKSQIWGGDLLYESFGIGERGQNTGESWELSAHESGSSIIASGEFAGLGFNAYLDIVLGYQFDRFPLLVKLIGPVMDLSVQVHPGDGYDKLDKNETGKSEAWYIVSAPQNGRIICGLNCDRINFVKALEQDNIENCLNYIPVAAGDVVEIKPGLVHALCAEVIVYEVQQNSDTTYRIHDWNRIDSATGEPRKLHIDHAMDVIDFGLQPQILHVPGQRGSKICVQNDKFILESLDIGGRFSDSGNGFGAYTVISGQGNVIESGIKLYSIKPGDTFFAPSCTGWEITGKLHILKASCSTQE